MTIDRVHAAREIAAETGIDLLVLTPGSDLRYLSGYHAHAMERLTALAVPRRGEPFLVVPRLEAPMVGASPAGGLGLELLAWDETDDPFALLARTATAAGTAPTASPSARARGPSTRSACSGPCPARRWRSPARSSTGCG